MHQMPIGLYREPSYTLMLLSDLLQHLWQPVRTAMSKEVSHVFGDYAPIELLQISLLYDHRCMTIAV